MTEAEIWQAFDKVWDEKGEKAAILALPLDSENNEIIDVLLDSGSECPHCGDLPIKTEYGPFRFKRTFVAFLLRRTPDWSMGDIQYDFCDCWEPTGTDSLETR